MSNLRIALITSAILLVLVTPAISGGIVKYQAEGTASNKLGDDEMASAYINRNLASGVSVDAYMYTILESRLRRSELEEDASYLTDYKTYFSAFEDVYYARTASHFVHELSDEENEPAVKEVLVESFVIMPKSFDAEIASNIRFSKEGGSEAVLNTKFVYDGVPYAFSIETDVEADKALKIFLYPYSPLLDGFNLDYENVYLNEFNGNDFSAEGALEIRALRSET